MAQEDDKTTVEVSEKDEAESAGNKKGSKKLLMLVGGGLGVVVIGVALALFVLKPMMAGEGGDSADQTEQTNKSEDHHKSSSKSSGHGSDHGESGSMVYAIKDIVVNPAGTGGTRFLSVSFGFDLKYAELSSEFEAREPLVRDALITILSSKTVAELTNAKQKEIIRYQVKKRLSSLMNTDGINGVYYTDFVLQ